MTESMDIYFMDVGQGDCTYVEAGEDGTANKESYLIDCGYKQRQFNGDHPARQTLTMLFNLISKSSHARGRPGPYIDHLFVTHAHADHWNMLAALIAGNDGSGSGANAWAPYWGGQAKTLTVGRLTFGGKSTDYSSGAAANATNWGVITAAAAICTDLTDREHDQQDNAGNVTPSWTGLAGRLKIHLICSNVPSKGSSGANAKSLCLIFEYDRFKAMLLGDAEAPDISSYVQLWYRANNCQFLQCDLLKLSHHGSVRGTPDYWGDLVKPVYVFASGDYFWSHPYQAAYQGAEHGGRVAPNSLRHWYSSSDKPPGRTYKEYIPDDTTKALFSSVWYAVTEDGPVTANNARNVPGSYAKGMFTGAAWLLQKDRGAAPQLAFAPRDVWPGPGQVPA